MSQQINLFNPIFLAKKKVFSALTMAQALGLVVLGSVILSGYTHFQLKTLAKEAEATSAQLALVQSQMKQVNAVFGAKDKGKTIDDEVRRAEADVNSLQQVFDVLQDGNVGNTNGYAEYFRAFSRQSLNGVWLTGFSIYGAGNDISLQGRALSADLVPVYISRLKRESILQGKSFATLEINTPPAAQDPAGQTGSQGSPGYIDFRLQSAGAAREAEPSGARTK